MPAYILVRAVDGWNPDEPMVYNRGYPVLVSDRNQVFPNAPQGPPRFCQVLITDATPEEIQPYCEEWWTRIDYEFLGHDYTIDGHRLRVFATPETISVSGLGRLTREQVEQWLLKWNCQNISVSTNEVQFDSLVYDAATSEGFWELPVGVVSFSAQSYEQGSGIHTIRCNYGDVDVNFVKGQITSKGGTVVSENPVRVVFQIHRDVVFSEFRAAVREQVERAFQRRKFAFESSEVDAALANTTPGPEFATLTLTRQQAALLIHNRLND